MVGKARTTKPSRGDCSLVVDMRAERIRGRFPWSGRPMLSGCAIPTKLDEFRAMVANEHLDRFERRLAELLADRTAKFRLILKLRLEGEPSWVLLSMSALRSGRYALDLSDLKDLREGEEEMLHLSCHDSRADLPNRKAFYLKARDLVLQSARAPFANQIAFLQIDIDGFKRVNDELGYVAGDAMLGEFAARLRRAMRESDYIFHFGSDSFMVVATHLRPSLTDVCVCAERIMGVVDEPFRHQGEERKLGLSVGISLYPRDAKELDELVRKAESALHDAMRQGNTYRLYHEELHAEASERLGLLSSLRGAIDGEGIYVEYQPIVDPEGRLVAVEALARWRHPVKGIVPPVDFIPLAEESGLIAPLGIKVMEQALADYAAMRPSEKGPFKLSINLSVKQLRDEGFVAMVEKLLARYGVEPMRIHLELTESTLMDDVGRSARVLAELKRLGIACSIDDFGTGYSSLSYIKDLPVHTIKIDRSFVMALGLQESGAAIIRSIVSLAEGLGIEVIAEGVETCSQARLLKALGVKRFQGFYYSMPLSSDRLFEASMQEKPFCRDEDDEAEVALA